MVPDNDIDHHWVIPPSLSAQIALCQCSLLPHIFFNSLTLQFGTKASFFVKDDGCTSWVSLYLKRIAHVFAGLLWKEQITSYLVCSLGKLITKDLYFAFQLGREREWHLYQTLTGSLNEIIVLRFLFQVIFLVLSFSPFYSGVWYR